MQQDALPLVYLVHGLPDVCFSLFLNFVQNRQKNSCLGRNVLDWNVRVSDLLDRLLQRALRLHQQVLGQLGGELDGPAESELFLCEFCELF